MTNLKIQMFANNKVINIAGSGFISFSRFVETKRKTMRQSDMCYTHKPYGCTIF